MISKKGAINNHALLYDGIEGANLKKANLESAKLTGKSTVELPKKDIAPDQIASVGYVDKGKEAINNRIKSETNRALEAEGKLNDRLDTIADYVHDQLDEIHVVSEDESIKVNRKSSGTDISVNIDNTTIIQKEDNTLGTSLRIRENIHDEKLFGSYSLVDSKNEVIGDVIEVPVDERVSSIIESIGLNKDGTSNQEKSISDSIKEVNDKVDNNKKELNDKLDDFSEQVENEFKGLVIKKLNPAEENIKESWGLFDKDDIQHGSTINYYKDTSLKSVEKIDEQTVRFTYEHYDDEGNIIEETVDIDFSTMVIESEIGDGLIIDSNTKVVSVRLDNSSEKFLTISSEGLKISGIQDAIKESSKELNSKIEEETNRAKQVEGELRESINNTTNELNQFEQTTNTTINNLKNETSSLKEDLEYETNRAKLKEESLSEQIANTTASANNAINGSSITGSGNVITSVSKSGQLLVFDKGINALTSHQPIYSATFSAGQFSGKTYTPNSAAQTINIPTHTSHLTNDSGFITSSSIPNVDSSILSFFDFSSRSTTAGWGNQMGEVMSCLNETHGGSLNFRRNNPYNGKMSALIDGYWYQQEGLYRVLDESDINSGLIGSNFIRKSGDTMTGGLTINANALVPLVISNTSYSTDKSRGPTIKFVGNDPSQPVFLRHEWFDSVEPGYGLVITKTDSTDTATEIAQDNNMFFMSTGKVIAKHQLESRVATGTAPLQVNSTTLVSNLNADMVDGKHDGQFTAAKLANAVTLWGQSFDGTQNVSGNMTGVGSVSGSGSDAPYLTMNITNEPTDEGNLGGAVGIGRASQSYGTFIWGDGSGKGHIQVGRKDGIKTSYSLVLQEYGGNVGIGTTSPSYKLHVAGAIYSNTRVISPKTIYSLANASGTLSIDAASYDIALFSLNGNVSGITLSSYPQRGCDIDILLSANGTERTITIANNTTYKTPTGESLTITVPANGYAEVNMLYDGTYVWVRGV